MTHARLWAGAAAAAACALAPCLAAQRVWRSNLYPYVYYSSMDGVWGAAHYGITSPLGFVERPELNSAALSFDAGASTQGSYSVALDAQAPALWPGWRLAVTLSATRDNRLGFYGLGNDSPFSADSVSANAPYYYRVSRTQAGARVTIQRRIIGPLRALVGVTVDRTNFRALPGGSGFRAALASDAVDSTAIPFTDGAVHAGLVFDTRDNELSPHAGVLAEALYASGSGYTRTTGSVRVYLHPLTRLVLAGRLAGEGMGGSPPLAPQLAMESSERGFVAVGGYHSVRGLYDARFVGPDKLLAGGEARYALLRAPSILEVMIVGYYDAGRVFAPGERFRVATTGLHTGGGGELAVRFLRNSLLVLGAGWGGEGAQLVFGTQWSY